MCHRDATMPMPSWGSLVSRLNFFCVCSYYWHFVTSMLSHTCSFSKILQHAVCSPFCLLAQQLVTRSFSVASFLPPALRTSNHAVSTLSAITSNLFTSSKSFHPTMYLPPCTSDSAFADIVCLYKFHLLTYQCVVFAVAMQQVSETVCF